MSRRKKIILLTAYLLTLTAVLWYPVWKIVSIEFPAEAPAELKFKVTVADPYDPMRGRYVRLGVRPDRIITRDEGKNITGRSAWLVLRRDPEGFAQAVRLEKECKAVKPGEIAVKVRNLWFSSGNWGKKKQPSCYRFTLPFDRFYLNELKAPELEAELRNRSRAKQYMVLKVNFFKNGLYAVTGLTAAPPAKKTVPPAKAAPKK